MRTLDDSFIEQLQYDGIFKSIVDYVEDASNRSILCIRENYINIYYKAHSLLKISQDMNDKEKFKIEFDLNHARYTCGINGAKKEIETTGIKPDYSGHFMHININTKEGLPDNFFDVVEILKKYIVDYFDGNKTFDYIREENGEEQSKRGKSNLLEKRRQQEIYSLGMWYKENGYVCYDRESAIEGADIKRIFGDGVKLGQPDCLFAKVENDVITKILFVEVKSTESACKTEETKNGFTSGILKHDNDFSTTLNNIEVQSILKKQMIHAFEVFGKLEINNYPSEIKVADDLVFDKCYVFTDEAIGFLYKGSECKDAQRIKELAIENKIYKYDARTELHLHTNMSAFDGVNSAEEYLQEGISLSMPAMAITDHASVQAYPEAYRFVKRNGFDIKLIYGLDIFIRTDSEQFPVTILVKNKQGLTDLYRLLSSANTKYYYKKPIIDKNELCECRDNLLIGAGCGSDLYKAVVAKKKESELVNIAKFYDYFEVYPYEAIKFLSKREGEKRKAHITEITKKVIRIGKSLVRKPVVATSDVHFLYTDDSECRRVMQHHRHFEDYQEQYQMHLHTTEEMLDAFDFLKKHEAYNIVVENPNAINDMIDDTFSPFPEKQSYSLVQNANKRIKELAVQGLSEKYTPKIPNFVEERMQEELKSITKYGYADLYILAKDVVCFSKDKGYAVGNRGSIASSLVAFLIGITDINPMEPHYYCNKCGCYEVHNEKTCGYDMADKYCSSCGTKFDKRGFKIPYETLAGLDGKYEPDIDLNFAPEVRDDVINYLISKFGNDRVVRAGTVSTIGDKSADKMLNEYCDENSYRFSDEKRKNILNKLSTVKRTTGMHPGGVFITPKGKKVQDYTPIQHPADDLESGITTSHYDFRALIDHLYKFDLLAHDDPSIIRKLEEITGIDSSSIPLNDNETIKLLNEGKTAGIPSLNEKEAREIISYFRINCFEDLVKISGLIHGTNTWTDTIKKLCKENRLALKETLACRDDVMLYLLDHEYDRDMAFHTSERIRKGKGFFENQEEHLRDYGIPEWFVTNCKEIKYLFPRAHCITYSMFAYKMAYYKTHYPLEFYCTYFTYYADYFNSRLLAWKINDFENNTSEINEYITNCRTLKEIAIMEVWLEMLSRGFEFAVENETDVKVDSFFIEDGKLRPKLKKTK